MSKILSSNYTQNCTQNAGNVISADQIYKRFCKGGWVGGGGGVGVGALNIFLSIFELQGLKSPSRAYMKGVKR